MKTMGIDELKVAMEQVIADLQNGETIQLTNDGEAIAMLMPVRRRRSAEEIKRTLDTLEEMSAMLSADLTEPVDATDLISEMRN